MLELLWVADRVEAQQEAVRRTGLWERWSRREIGDVSPFGVCLRPGSMAHSQPPFPSWEYKPPWVDAGPGIYIAEESPLDEPLWFVLSNESGVDVLDLDRRPPIEHAAGLRELTRVRIVSPASGPVSSTARRLVELGVLTMATDSQHSLQLTFDGGNSGRIHDFRPGLPLIFRW
jgi:hypothetical protein